MDGFQGRRTKGAWTREQWLAAVLTTALAACAAPDDLGEKEAPGPDEAPSVEAIHQNVVQVDGAYVDWVWGSALPGWTQNIENKVFQLIDNAEALSTDATTKKIHIAMLHWNGATGAMGADKLKRLARQVGHGNHGDEDCLHGLAQLASGRAVRHR